MPDIILELASAYQSLAFEYRDLVIDITNHVRQSAILGLTTVDSAVILTRIDEGQKRVSEINNKVLCQVLNK
jgi:hypothetical protein